MTRLPRAKGREIVRALEKRGFVVDRTRGSHVFLKHPDGRATAVPVHGAFDFSCRGPSGVFTFDLKLLTFNLPSPLPFPRFSTILSNPTPLANPFPRPT